MSLAEALLLTTVTAIMAVEMAAGRRMAGGMSPVFWPKYSRE